MRSNGSEELDNGSLRKDLTGHTSCATRQGAAASVAQLAEQHLRQVAGSSPVWLWWYAICRSTQPANRRTHRKTEVKCEEVSQETGVATENSLVSADENSQQPIERGQVMICP